MARAQKTSSMVIALVSLVGLGCLAALQVLSERGDSGSLSSLEAATAAPAQVAETASSPTSPRPAPRPPRDGRMFLYVTDLENHSNLVSFPMVEGRPEPNGRRLVLFQEQPGLGHQGGDLHFDDVTSISMMKDTS